MFLAHIQYVLWHSYEDVSLSTSIIWMVVCSNSKCWVRYDVQHPIIAIPRTQCRNGQSRPLIDPCHCDSLLSPVFLVALNNIQSVNPQIANFNWLVMEIASLKVLGNVPKLPTRCSSILLWVVLRDKDRPQE